MSPYPELIFSVPLSLNNAPATLGSEVGKSVILRFFNDISSRMEALAESPIRTI